MADKKSFTATEEAHARSPRLRDWILLSNFAPAQAKPEKINFLEHLFPYRGAPSKEERKRLGILWGLYGTVTRNAVLYVVSKAQRNIMQIDLHHHTFGDRRSHVTLEDLRSPDNNMMHLDRVSVDLRRFIRELWLTRISETRGASAVAQFESLSLDMMAAHAPDLVLHFMEHEVPSVDAMIHPVFPQWASEEGGSDEILWVATVRNKPDNFLRAEVRYLPGVKVVFED